MANRLPSPRDVLTSLFNQLPQQSQSATIGLADANPLKYLAARERQLFVTLHCLFPNEFLPALDLLDRRLVARFILQPEPTAVATQEDALDERSNWVYYVRSAQPARTSRYMATASGTSTSYEVRLEGWNCSCPAFAFSAFAPPGGERQISDDVFNRERESTGGEQERWSFGGLTLGQDDIPVCKHLLACVMVERCGLLAGCVDERMVGRQEAAGWGAGWGG